MHTSPSHGPAQLIATRSWTVDPSASTVGFRIRHFGVATVEGRFTRFAGSVGEWGAGGRVDAASVDTGNEIRDTRLRSELFDVDRYPDIAFRTAAPLAGAVTGELTIRDVTRPLTIELTAEHAGADRIALRGRASIKRREFGLEWDALREAGRLLVSDGVDLVLDLVLVRA